MLAFKRKYLKLNNVKSMSKINRVKVRICVKVKKAVVFWIV